MAKERDGEFADGIELLLQFCWKQTYDLSLTLVYKVPPRALNMRAAQCR